MGRISSVSLSIAIGACQLHNEAITIPHYYAIVARGDHQAILGITAEKCGLDARTELDIEQEGPRKP